MMGVKHPVLDYQIDRTKADEYEKAVELVMAVGEDQLPHSCLNSRRQFYQIVIFQTHFHDEESPES